MQLNKQSYNVLSTLTTAGGDITYSNPFISITGAPKFDWRKVNYSSGVVATQAETVQVDTLTPTSAASTVYSIQLIQTQSNGVVLNEVFTYTSPATSSATIICNAFRTLINASNFAIAATGTATLILTADAGTPVFTSSVSASVGTIAIVLTTPGVYAKNTYASLVAAGVAATDLTVGATYSSFTFEYVSLDATLDINTESSVNRWTVYVRDGITNLAAFIAKLNLVNSAITTNPLNLQLTDNGLTAAINSTATATAAEVSTGWITSTSGAATAITLPTGTLLGAQLGASKGTVHELYIDNTGGSNTVTIVVATNGILSDAATTTAASFGQLTVASGVTGLARFTLMFSSATAYAFTRTA